MSRMRSGLIGVLVFAAMLTLTPATRAADNEAAKLWGDFIHYIRVAQLELAAGSGEALLARNLAAPDLLGVIEASPYRRDYEKDLIRAQTLKAGDNEQATRLIQVARKVSDAITAAQVAVVRDPERIRAAIERLDDGQRANMNAVALLREAGEYAAPQMVDVLLSRKAEDRALSAHVLEAMVAIGRPMAVPLCEAMMKLPPVQQQQVARVVGRIGYPLALPYLKAIVEDTTSDPELKNIATRAFGDIATRTGTPMDLSAADLFLKLGWDYYAGAESLTLQPDASHNLMWMAEAEGRLSYLHIPTPVYGDAMAMRSAKMALTLNPNLSPALSLWIGANFRRENNLPAGTNDPSYGPDMRSPLYYANLAGPRHVHPVLSKAMNDRDADLALDTIASLTATAGTTSIISDQPSSQTLLAALNYPDRRVRFEAAFAIARATPTSEFAGSGRVIPVLASALRQSGKLNAAVVANDVTVANVLAQRVRRAGNYDVVLGDSLEAINDQLINVAEVDVVVVQLPAAEVDGVYAGVRKNYKMQGAPVLILAEGGELIALNRRFADEPGASVTDAAAGEANMAAALTQALGPMAAGQIDNSQAHAYAMQAVSLLRDLAVADSKVFDVTLAESAMESALGDPREDVAIAAAQVLSLLTGSSAQQALAATALNGASSTNVRINMLKSLATSAKKFGNNVPAAQADQLLELVQSATGELADAAAQAHGALNLPTANAVAPIVK